MRAPGIVLKNGPNQKRSAEKIQLSNEAGERQAFAYRPPLLRAL